MVHITLGYNFADQLIGQQMQLSSKNAQCLRPCLTNMHYTFNKLAEFAQRQQRESLDHQIVPWMFVYFLQVYNEVIRRYNLISRGPLLGSGIRRW
jgi:hypothetical protein